MINMFMSCKMGHKIKIFISIFQKNFTIPLSFSVVISSSLSEIHDRYR